MKLRRYLSRFGFVTLLLLLIGAGVGLVVFQARGGRTFSIQSGSMEPAMSKGGLVGANPVSGDNLRVGDVITFMSPEDRDVTITHRIVELERSSETGRQIITTKGDANDFPDPPISESLVVGRSDLYIPYAGSALDFVRKPIGLLILIYVPALTVVIAEIRKLKDYYKSIEPYVLR